MDFYAVLDQVVDLLRRRGRVTYGALKRQFQLDDAYLNDLKNELIEGQRLAADERGTVLVWTGAVPAMQPTPRPSAETERQFQAVLLAVMAVLQREQRVTYRTLTYLFGLDKARLEEVREELTLRQVAYEEQGKVLVWTGAALSTLPPAVVGSSQRAPVNTDAVTSLAVPSLQPHVLPPAAPANPPIAVLPTPLPAAPQAVPAAAPDDAPALPRQSVRSVPEAERRQLTVLFCDLVGSTQLSGQLDPEDLRAVVRAYQEAAAEVIQHYAGYIAQYLGDGLLVYFGYPTAHEDEARRAVHTGLGIVQAIVALNTRLATQYGVHLAVRVGIHTGPVVVGVMGGGGRHEHLALGETPNIAARLQALAPANAVVISAVTARLVQGVLTLEDLGTHTLYGVAEPMVVSRVSGLLETPSYDEEFVAGGVPVLVGREEESGLLHRRWEQSKAGLGQVVFVSGEAGIGKSALVEGLRVQVHAEGLPCMAFRCSPYHTNSALYPVITHLERLLQFVPDDLPATRLAKLEAGLHPYGLPLAEVVPLLAGLLSVPLPVERYAPLRLTSQQQKQQTLDALVAWLAAEAERQPMLVLWEDLHWADPTTLEVLGLVIEQAPTMPMLHVLTARPEFSPPWPPRSHITPLVLNRLERSQVETLITQRAGGKTLPAEVVQHIVDKTDGVPLYVEELMKMLLASALLRAEADQYVLTGPLHTVAIPDTLQDALMARLDQLKRAKEVAQLGAVLGREFPYDLLQAIAPHDEATLHAGLAQLVEAELLYQRGRLPRARYIFKHALIQEAAYASLLKSTRQQVHQQVAQALEARFPAVVETQPELVAQHYTAAGCTEQAVRYWQQAGQQAVWRSAHREAIAHLTKGLEVLQAVPDTPVRMQQELAFHLALCTPLQVVQGIAAPEVMHAYTRAHVLCQQVGEAEQLSQVLWGLYAVHHTRAEWQTAWARGEQLLALAQRLQNPEILLEAHRALGGASFFLGQYAAARTYMEQGLALYDAQQYRSHTFLYSQNPKGQFLAVMAWSQWICGYPAQARQCSDELLAFAQAFANPHELTYALVVVAALHQFRREVQAVQARADTAIALATEHGFVLWRAYATILRGWALATQGQTAEGIASIRQGITAWQATGAAWWRPYFLALLAEAYGKARQTGEALAVLAEALTTVQNTGEHLYEAELQRLTGELLLVQEGTQHTWRAAEERLDQALAIARSQHGRALELRAAVSLARLWQRQGKHDQARELLAEVYGWFTEGFDTADLQEAQTLLGALT